MSPRRRPPRWSDSPDDEDGAQSRSAETRRMTSRVLGYDRLETGPDGREWAVRAVTGQAAVKTYRCPGCDHEVRVGQPHLVVWPKDDYGQGVHDRRHWHTPCWNARGRRR